MSEAFFYLIISLGNNAGVKEKFLRITIISFRKMNIYVNYDNFCQSPDGIYRVARRPSMFS